MPQEWFPDDGSGWLGYAVRYSFRQRLVEFKIAIGALRSIKLSQRFSQVAIDLLRPVKQIHAAFLDNLAILAL